PEHSPKNHLREDTADILISSSQQRSVNKNKTVTSVSVLIENCCQKHAAKSPYNAEWSEHNTAAAHNNAVLHITEDRLYHISKKGSQEKDADQLVKAASRRKNIRFCFCLFDFLLSLQFCLQNCADIQQRIGLFKMLQYPFCNAF